MFRINYEKADLILYCTIEKLRQERERRGLSLKQFGALSGVERTTIGKIKKGERSPSLLICLWLADRLGDALNSIPAKRWRK